MRLENVEIYNNPVIPLNTSSVFFKMQKFLPNLEEVNQIVILIGMLAKKISTFYSNVSCQSKYFFFDRLKLRNQDLDGTPLPTAIVLRKMRI